jgi:hypothetical protein
MMDEKWGEERGSHFWHRRPWRIFRPIIVLLMVLGGLGFAVLLAFVFGFVIQFLWNWLMPDLFGLKAITYWQGFGIFILGKILFGSFGHNFHNHHRQWKRHFRGEDWDGSHHWFEDGTWKPGGAYRNWKYYNKYWRDEGKAAFEAYLEKMKPGTNP